jgi:hypothetical protein
MNGFGVIDNLARDVRYAMRQAARIECLRWSW